MFIRVQVRKLFAILALLGLFGSVVFQATSSTNVLVADGSTTTRPTGGG